MSNTVNQLSSSSTMQSVQVESSSLTSSCSDQVTSSTGDQLANASIENDTSSTMNQSLPTLENQERTVSIQTMLNDQTNVVPDQRTKSQRRKDRRFREKQQRQIQALQRQHLKELDQLRQRQVKEHQQRLEQRGRYWIDQQQKKHRQQALDTFGVQCEQAEQIHTTANTTITPLHHYEISMDSSYH